MFGRKRTEEAKIDLVVDDTERRLIVRALADLRDKQRMENKSYDFLDTLIVKVCDAQSNTVHRGYERS